MRCGLLCRSENGARQWRVAEALQYGMVGCNTFSVSHAAAPFGGVKESGVGREGSKYGIDDYVTIKSVRSYHHTASSERVCLCVY